MTTRAAWNDGAKRRCRWLGAVALCIALASPALHAQSRITEPPASPYVKDNGEVLLMVCRRSQERQDMQPMQEMPQDLPLLCLATQTTDEALQMSPARFQQLLETAAGAGAMLIVVVPER